MAEAYDPYNGDRSGTVESKLRTLVVNLEQNTPIIQVAHPWIEGKSAVHVCQGEFEIRQAAAGNGGEIPRRTESEEGISKVWTTTFYIGLGLVKPKKCRSYRPLLCIYPTLPG